MMMTDPNELEALKTRMQQLHADAWKWFDAPTKPVAPILLQALALAMELVVALTEARSEIDQLRAELAERPASQRRLDD